MMPTISKPNSKRAGYVTYMASPPLRKHRGHIKKLVPVSRGIHGQRLQQRPWEYSTIGGSVRQEHDAKYVNFLGIRGGFTIDFAGQGWYTKRREKGAREPLNEILLRPFGVLPDGRFLSGIFETDVL